MTMTKEESGARSFARFIQDAGEGDLLRDLSEANHELGNALQNEALHVNGKVKGELKLVLKYSCDARGNVGIDWDVSVKKPKKTRVTAQAWVNKQGNLVFEPPRQIALPLREIGGRAELRDVGDNRGLKEV